MGSSAGFMDGKVEVGESARLPDGTSARVTEVGASTIRGVRRLEGGQEVKFSVGFMSWLLLRQGYIPTGGSN